MLKRRYYSYSTNQYCSPQTHIHIFYYNNTSIVIEILASIENLHRIFDEGLLLKTSSENSIKSYRNVFEDVIRYYVYSRHMRIANTRYWLVTICVSNLFFCLLILQSVNFYNNGEDLKMIE